MAWWKWILGPYMLVVIWAAFQWAPQMTRPNYQTGTLEPWESFRIVFFHVPAAWTCVVAFLVSMVASVGVLRNKSLQSDRKAMSAAQLGFLFGALALISGMLWARNDWGAAWNWDPRQTSVAILLLIYGAYFALRGSIQDPRNRARLSAVYSPSSFFMVNVNAECSLSKPALAWSGNPATCTVRPASRPSAKDT